MTDYDTWRKVAFSHTQIADFLSVVALPHYEVGKLLPPGSVLYTCFCTGFYFFCYGIQNKLDSPLAEELLNLAVRVEALKQHPSELLSSQAVWNQNAEEARRLLIHHFDSDNN